LAQETVIETDTLRLKIGDGVKTYSALVYASGGLDSTYGEIELVKSNPGLTKVITADITTISAESNLLANGATAADAICMPSDVSAIPNGKQFLILGGNSDCNLYSDATRTDVSLVNSNGWGSASGHLTISFKGAYRVTLMKIGGGVPYFRWLFEVLTLSM